MTEDNKEKDYIDQHKEWQRHQFDPGYYTGGRVPVWLKYPGNPRLLGIVLLLMGFFYLIFSSIGIVFIFTSEFSFFEGGKAITIFILSIALILAGIKFIKKSNIIFASDKKKKFK